MNEKPPPDDSDDPDFTICGVSWEVWAGILFWVIVFSIIAPSPFLQMTLHWLVS